VQKPVLKGIIKLYGNSTEETISVEEMGSDLGSPGVVNLSPAGCTCCDLAMGVSRGWWFLTSLLFQFRSLVQGCIRLERWEVSGLQIAETSDNIADMVGSHVSGLWGLRRGATRGHTWLISLQSLPCFICQAGLKAPAWVQQIVALEIKQCINK
jgi:hypothetical protein